MHRKRLKWLPATLACLAALPVRAEVLDAGAAGFSLRHEVVVNAPRMEAYRALVDDVGQWWNPDHTMSGNSETLYIDARVPGCFCEVLGPDAGIVHLAVTFVNPGVVLRLSGGLGPLGLMGVSGNMTYEFDDAGDTPGATRVTLRYAVGGYHPDGLDALAVAVDGVLADALARLARHIEKTRPDSGVPSPP